MIVTRTFEKVLVVDYTRPRSKLTSGAITPPKSDVIENLIQDINAAEEIQDVFDNFSFDSLGPLADEVLDYIVAVQNRNDTQIQDYKQAIKKLLKILAESFTWGKSVVLLGHLQVEKDMIGNTKQNPQVWGKDLPSDIPKKFSEVFLSTIIPKEQGVRYVWQTQPTSWIGFLGSRKKDNLAKYIDPDFTKLYGEKHDPFSALVIGESHTGKTRSIGTLPGKTILFYVEQQIRGYDSLRVPFEVTSSLRKWLVEKK